VLPTLAFILLAYAMYALLTAWPRRNGGPLRGRSRGRRYRWLTLIASGGAGLGLVLWLSLSGEPQNHDLKLAGFLGTVWAEGQPDNVDARAEYPLAKGQGAGGQPVYALLNPGTPPGAMGPERKPPATKQVRKMKSRKSPSPQAKVAKASNQATKKDKVATKNRPKKKKQSSAPAGQKAKSG